MTERDPQFSRFSTPQDLGLVGPHLCTPCESERNNVLSFQTALSIFFQGVAVNAKCGGTQYNPVSVAKLSSLPMRAVASFTLILPREFRGI